MVPFDWRVLDRLGSIWRSNTVRATRLAPEEASVTLIIPTTAAAATSTLQTVSFPMEGQFVWYGTTAIPVDDAGVVLIVTDQFGFELTPMGHMISIREGQNGKTFARHGRVAGTPEQFAPVSSITGLGTRPYFLPFPVFLNPGDFLEVLFFNGGPVAAGLQLTFLGWKLTQ